MKLSTFILTALVLLSPIAALASHDKGHQTVAAIACDQMTPQARARAVTLLRNAPMNSEIRALRPTTGSAAERDRVQFIRAATWADKVRVGPRKPLFHKGIWHYTDYFWEQQTTGGPKRQRPDVPPHGDLVTMLPALETSLRNLHGSSVTLTCYNPPSPQYRDLVIRVSQKAIALAGYRLGETLNGIFGH